MKSTPPSVSLKKDINYFHRKQFFKRETRKSKSKFRENIHPSFLRWLNSLQFLSFKGEFFAIFILQGWILCTFYPYGWILCNFYLLEIFFVWKGQKFTFLIVNFFDTMTFILVIGVFLSGILRVYCFDTNHPFSFGWFVDIFYPSSVYFYNFYLFWIFWDENGQKFFL